MAGKIIPGLIPSRPDLDQPTGRVPVTADPSDTIIIKNCSFDNACRQGLFRQGGAETGQQDLLVGCLSGVSRLLKGKSCPRSAGPVADMWMKKMRGGLASALSGGQWSQTRKASVPAFGITDSQCQLCHTAPGTLEHRFRCEATRPSQGWPDTPPLARKALGTIGAKRREVLKDRGLLVIRLPARSHADEGEFRWIVDPTECEVIDNAAWYFDGSMLNGRWKALRLTGFGVAVATPAGDLLGNGLGWPPTWVTTAAAAEAWALSVVLELVPFPPPSQD